MVIKCKRCGGDLHPENGKTVCECEYCGTMQTIPTDDGEKKTNLFNRANRLRMNAEFDKAAAVYESIAAEFLEEAEAYWGLCLCAYGIEYVDDPETGEKKPTCHRTLPTSIMEDGNFEQACDNADAIARRVYREEAKTIDRIQKDILSIVSNEEPYDVFICYKETAEEGGRTEDSVLAQDIYDSLTGKDLKVFFSRITLEDKLGQQYEPYIYAALSSAKVMLAIGTRFEHYDAVWVKNEWMRFLSMMKTEKGKTLIPCYKGIDAYDMPKEFKNLQGQDMGKLGWLQDLTRGVLKLCGKDIRNTTQEDTRNIQRSSPTTDSLLERARIFLEDKNWTDANQYADKALDIEPKNPMAYVIKLLVDLRKTKLDALKNSSVTYEDNENYKKIIRFYNQYPQYNEQIRLIIDMNEIIDKTSRVYEAIKQHNVDAIASLLDEGVSPNLEYENEDYKGTIINYAVMQCDSNIVQLLLSKGGNPNSERILKNGCHYSALRDCVEEILNDKIAKMLIDAGADVNHIEENQDGVTYPVLMSAIMQGNIDISRIMLENGANPDLERKFKDGNHYSMLRESIEQWPNDEIAKMLIDAGADLNHINSGSKASFPALISAIIMKNVTLVRLLLAKGANPNSERIFKDGSHYSALSDSIDQWPNDEIAKMLIQAGADVNYICAISESGVEYPVLMSAIMQGNTNILQLMLDKGADPNIERKFKNGNHYSMLRESIEQWPNDEIAKILIDTSEDINHVNSGSKASFPVLISAIIMKNAALVRLLLNKGADPNSERIFKDGTHYSALSDSIDQWPNDDIAKMLIDAGADVNYICATNESGVEYPVLMSAIIQGNANILQLMLDKGADPNIERKFKDGNHYSMLRESIEQWPNDEIAKMLIDAGADLNHINSGSKASFPALISAIIMGNENMAQLLLKRGANPNSERIFKEGNRYSALRDSIAEWPNDEIAKMLIQAGANVNYVSREQNGTCPILNYAIMKGNIQIVDRLLKAGADPNCERVLDNGKRFSAVQDSKETWPNPEISALLRAKKIKSFFRR